jgi:hypothetical protein
MSQRFGTSAPKAENGFVGVENCFVAAFSAKHSGRKCELFQYAENWWILAANPQAERRRVGPAQRQSSLVMTPRRREDGGGGMGNA